MVTSRVQTLLNQMTVQEKIGQLLQLPPDAFTDGQAAITGPLKAKAIDETTLYTAGSILGISGAKQLRQLQANYLAHNRLHIPLLFMFDVIHGFQTIFPIPLALGATFDPDLVEKTAQVAAAEASASGIHVTFAPMLDLVRDPRWGRVMESTGEDAFLNSALAKAQVRGFQGSRRPLANDRVAACIKHFAAYGAAEAGRDYNTVDLSEWRFKEQYLPAYQAAVDAGALLVMTSFNTLFGTPASANQHLLRDILREEMQFKGVVISDWNAIGELIPHGVAKDDAQAADKALKAGIDIDMVYLAYATFLRRAAALDDETREQIDTACSRVLTLKETLGLFDDPYRGISEDREKAVVFSQAHQKAAEKAAEEAIVLLQNRQKTLPLTAKTRAALIGPAAASSDILGSWDAVGQRPQTENLSTAMRRHFNHLTVAKGCDYLTGNKRDLKLAEKAAQAADVVVAAVGLPSLESGEASSLSDIRLPKVQRHLIKHLAALGKPLVLVIFTGRPLDLSKEAQLADAMVLAWFPGTGGAQAISNVLDGTVDPSGKLPMTFPRSVGQVPIYYDAYTTGRPAAAPDKIVPDKSFQSAYMDIQNTPQFAFGYGLSYADLAITQVKVDAAPVTSTHPLQILAVIHNHSAIAGATVIQAYIHQQVAETVRPGRSLKAFCKVMVPAHCDVMVPLLIDKKDLASVHTDLTTSTDAGDYDLFVGLDSTALPTSSFTVAAD